MGKMKKFRISRGQVINVISVVISALISQASHAVETGDALRLNRASPVPASYVDLQRYLGKWYEIASVPIGNQQDCVGTTATYETDSREGGIKVINRCLIGSMDGVAREAVGRAYVTDQVSNSQLRVSFGGPFQADYWILEVGENYEFAVVGEPSGTYAWILARESVLDQGVLEDLLNRLEVKHGYDRGRLKLTPQE